MLQIEGSNIQHTIQLHNSKEGGHGMKIPYTQNAYKIYTPSVPLVHLSNLGCP